jgi:uncharacterized protein
MNKLLASLLFSLLLTPLAYADFIPPEAPDGYVLDEAEILSDETEATLQTQLTTLETDTSTQIVVVTLSDLQGYPIEEASLAIGRTWGVGQEEFNNGVVFLIAPNNQAARIEVGYGLEGAITDAQSNAILGESINFFMIADYDTGTLEGINYLEILARGEEFPLEEVTLNETSDGSIWLILFYLIPFAWALLSWMSSTKAWWIGGIFGGIIGLIATWAILGVVIGIAAGLGLDLLLSTVLYKKLGTTGKGPWYLGGGKGGRGGSSGGGFGGFGGGGFGGGGASGSW